MSGNSNSNSNNAVNDDDENKSNASVKIKHEWKLIETHKVDTEAEGMGHAGTVFVLFVGLTGTGKTTLINILSGGLGQVGSNSNSTKSATKKAVLVGCVDQSALRFVDTQGLGDSHGDVDDEFILANGIFKFLRKENINAIKIVWAIFGDSERQNQAFVKQAKFIQQLGGDAVWQSVLLVKKKGKPKMRLKDVRSFLDVAKRFGANRVFEDMYANEKKKHDHPNLFGFTLRESITGDITEEYEILEDYDECDHNRVLANTFGVVSKEDVKTRILAKLDKLPVMVIAFREERCVRCGVLGDRRGIFDPCHTKKVRMHDSDLEKRHGDSKPQVLYYHGSSKTTTAAEGFHYHPSTPPVCRHRGEPKYVRHSKTFKSQTVGRVFAGIFTLGITEFGTWGYYPCCTRSGKDASYCVKEWTCCGEDPSKVICTSDSSKKVFTCCGQEYNQQGCKWTDPVKVHKCCGNPVGTRGCLSKYKCCGKPLTASGCEKFYAGCCRKKEGSLGCADKCNNCMRLWGQRGPGWHGCQIAYSY